MEIGTAIFVIFCVCLLIWAMNTEAGRAIIGGFVVLCILAGAWAYQRNQTVNAANAACPYDNFYPPNAVHTPGGWDDAAHTKCVRDHGG